MLTAPAAPALGRFLAGPRRRGGRFHGAAGAGRSGQGPAARADRAGVAASSYAAAGALVNERGDILYLHGRTGPYLEPAPGEAGIRTS